MSNPIFRKGAKVVCPRVPDNPEEWPNFAPEMSRLVGEVMTVTSTYTSSEYRDEDTVSARGFRWRLSWLVPAGDQKKIFLEEQISDLNIARSDLATELEEIDTELARLNDKLKELENGNN